MVEPQPKKPRLVIIIKKAKPNGFKTILRLIIVAIILTAMIGGTVGRSFICAQSQEGMCKRSFFGSFGTKNEGLNPMRRPLNIIPRRPAFFYRAKPTEPPTVIVSEEYVEPTDASFNLETIIQAFGPIQYDENIWERALEPQPEEVFGKPNLQLPSPSLVFATGSRSSSNDQEKFKDA